MPPLLTCPMVEVRRREATNLPTLLSLLMSAIVVVSGGGAAGEGAVLLLPLLRSAGC